MPNSPEEDPPLNPESVTEMARSYGAVLDGQAWEVDVPSAPECAGPEPQGEATASPPAVERILEALLFVGGGPLTLDRANAAVRGLTDAQLKDAIDDLNLTYRRQGRPYHVQVQDHGYIVTLRPRFRPVVDRLYGQAKEARLSPAAIDVLSLVAYRQPVTKMEVDSIRGIESGGLLRQLVRRGLVAIAQRGEADRREVTYGTTARFLELFDLKSLDDLPQTQDLQKL
ncbi:MAG TPA: SMC-Scp complex subunit ScpB [Gemmataceae bacterium]|nr:SMC-Scp complex subunit ScpB [Gemmataceae bacterium]